LKGADGISVKERLSADDHRGDRQGGIGPGVGLSLLQARHPGMRAEWFDLPGLNSPARHDSLMSGPEGRKERFDLPWNTSRYRKDSLPCAVCFRRARPGRELAFAKVVRPAPQGASPDCFRRVNLSRRLPFVNNISKDRTFLRKKKKYVLTNGDGSVILIGGCEGNLSRRRRKAPFCLILIADLSERNRHCRAMA
jgi:hypothetical protein